MRSVKHVDEGFVDSRVQRFGVARERMAGGQGEAVGQLAVVQDRPAARLPADDGALAAGGMLVAIVVALEVAERERRLAPPVEPQRGDAALGRVDEQRFIDRHVPGPGAGGSMMRRQSTTRIMAMTR